MPLHELVPVLDVSGMRIQILARRIRHLFILIGSSSCTNPTFDNKFLQHKNVYYKYTGSSALDHIEYIFSFSSGRVEERRDGEEEYLQNPSSSQPDPVSSSSSDPVQEQFQIL